MDKRPGLYLDPIDFDKVRAELKANYGGVTETDLASHLMYPGVFKDYKKFVAQYGDLSVLPTRFFLSKPEIGEEFHVTLEKGKMLILKLLAVGPLSEQTGLREVFYEVNGEVRQVSVEDKHAAVENVRRPKVCFPYTSRIIERLLSYIFRPTQATLVKSVPPWVVWSSRSVSRTDPKSRRVTLSPFFPP